jgi:VIT1/CCC1 family predicted Fe2+/Mn2+ transporter
MAMATAREHGDVEAQVRGRSVTIEDLEPHTGVEEDPRVHRRQGEWIRDVTLGANDGLVSVLTLLAGVAGATSGRVVLIAGIAGLVAGAISMGIGAYVSAKAYRAFYRKELAREVREIRETPDLEREEIREIYRARGFEGPDLDMVVGRITSNPRVWLKVMMQEELGLSAQFGRPVGAALAVFVAFVAGGIVPVIPFVFLEGTTALLTAFGSTAVALIAAGYFRSWFTGERPFRAGLELVLMAAVGVGAANGIGRLLAATGVTG